ncbi:helix-turn-helix domain-containing protein [Brachybacterium sp. GCM10030268]|uniref:helix-turn-helix domain-containing protein n=1 Tax=Brachybacterium sp. GCM10030268 TaxID=3273382 RepID=UPI003615DCDF
MHPPGPSGHDPTEQGRTKEGPPVSSKDKDLLIVRAVTEQGLTHAQAAARYGTSRQWVHTLVLRYQTGGPPALEPRSRAPRTRPGTTPASLRARTIVGERHRSVESYSPADPCTVVIASRADHRRERMPGHCRLKPYHQAPASVPGRVDPSRDSQLPRPPQLPPATPAVTRATR